MLRELNLLWALFAILVLFDLASAQTIQPADKTMSETALVLPGRVPENCPKGAKLETIRRDKGTGTKPSPVLTQWMQQIYNNPQFPTRGYAVKGPDRAFYDSFSIGGCRVCAAIITAQVENEGGHNDSFNVALSPAALPFPPSSFIVKLLSYGTPGATAPFGLWTSPTETSKTLSINLNANSINQYIVSGIQAPYLDVFTQDDTKVNSMQLDIWRY
jgi:hypothetical protein